MGSSLVRMTVPDAKHDHEVYQELDYAKTDLEEIGIPEDWTTPEINEAILNLAAQQLGATWCYFGCTEFKYRYGGEYVEEDDGFDDDMSLKMREAVRRRLKNEN